MMTCGILKKIDFITTFSGDFYSIKCIKKKIEKLSFQALHIQLWSIIERAFDLSFFDQEAFVQLIKQSEKQVAFFRFIKSFKSYYGRLK